MSKELTPQSWADVTKSDTVPVGPTIGLYVGGAGDVIGKGTDGVVGTFTCSAGQYLTGNFTYVMAATTATGIVALRG